MVRERRWPVAALGAVLLTAWSAAAGAEVVLETAVSKVETTLDNDGQARRELLPADDVVPGEELRYTITFSNESETPVDAERIVITNPIPAGTRYVAGSAGGEGSRVEFSTGDDVFEPSEPAGAATSEGAEAQAAPGQTVESLRWTYGRRLAPGDSAEVFFHVRMQ